MVRSAKRSRAAVASGDSDGSDASGDAGHSGVEIDDVVWVKGLDKVWKSGKVVDGRPSSSSMFTSEHRSAGRKGHTSRRKSLSSSLDWCDGKLPKGAWLLVDYDEADKSPEWVLNEPLGILCLTEGGPSPSRSCSEDEDDLPLSALKKRLEAGKNKIKEEVDPESNGPKSVSSSLQRSGDRAACGQGGEVEDTPSKKSSGTPSKKNRRLRNLVAVDQSNETDSSENLSRSAGRPRRERKPPDMLKPESITPNPRIKKPIATNVEPTPNGTDSNSDALVKRGRGRPRKYHLPDPDEDGGDLEGVFLAPDTEDDPIIMNDFYPEKVLKLREVLELSYAALFREARMLGGAMNSAYLWIRGEHMHRPAIQEAGKILARWYKASLHRAPANFKEAKRSWKSLGKESFRAPRQPSSVKTSGSNTPSKSAISGVQKSESGRYWEVCIPLTKDVEPCTVARFDTQDQAASYVKKVERAAASRMREMRAQRAIDEEAARRRKQRIAFCTPCNKRESPEPRECASCLLRYHPKCLKKEMAKFFWKHLPITMENIQRDSAVIDKPEFTCSQCLYDLLSHVRTKMGWPEELPIEPGLPSSQRGNSDLPESELSQENLTPAQSRRRGREERGRRQAREEESRSREQLRKRAEVRRVRSSMRAGDRKVNYADDDDDDDEYTPPANDDEKQPVRSSGRHRNGDVSIRDSTRSSSSYGTASRADSRRESNSRHSRRNDRRRSAPARDGAFVDVSGTPGRRLTSLLSEYPSGRVETHGPEFAFSFPISKSFIPQPSSNRIRSKYTRRKDGIDLASNTKWLGEGFVDGTVRSRSRIFYTGFKFLDKPELEYKVLDHVLLFCISPDGEEEEEGRGGDDDPDVMADVVAEQRNPHKQSGKQEVGEDREQAQEKLIEESVEGSEVERLEQDGAREDSAPGDEAADVPTRHDVAPGNEAADVPRAKDAANGTDRESKPSSTPDFYLGQIEALWEEANLKRKARISWFFWPSEAQTDEDIGGYAPREVFSSHEVDAVDISSIATRIKILPLDEFERINGTVGGLAAVEDSIRRNDRSSIDDILAKLESPEIPSASATSTTATVSSGAGTPVNAGQGSVATTPTRAGLSTRQESRISEAAVQEGENDESSKEKNSSNSQVELGVILKKKHATKLERAPRLLFAKRHFHFRANKLVGRDHPSFANGSAINPWMHHYLYATLEKPDTTHLLQASDLGPDKVCDYTLGIADTVGDGSLDTLHQVGSLDELLDNAPLCAFCGENMPFTGHIKCAVCTGVSICFDCFSIGRRGVVTTCKLSSGQQGASAVTVQEVQPIGEGVQPKSEDVGATSAVSQKSDEAPVASSEVQNNKQAPIASTEPEKRNEVQAKSDEGPVALPPPINVAIAKPSADTTLAGDMELDDDTPKNEASTRADDMELDDDGQKNDTATAQPVSLSVETRDLGTGSNQKKSSSSVTADVTAAVASAANSRHQSESNAAHDVKMLHRSNHPYRVSNPQLDYSNPPLALSILEWMCSHYGLKPPSFVLVAVVRGPLPTREMRGPAVRYRFATEFEYAPSFLKAKQVKTGQVNSVLASRYGKTVEEAKGVAAVDALCAVFGVSNKYNVPVLSSDWRAREALRLIDSLGIHSLAWEPAEEVVGHRNAQACAEFFSCYLHPAWAAQSEWAAKIRKLQEDDALVASERKSYEGAVPAATPTATEAAVREAIEWGVKVHEMAVRRSKASRRKQRGLAFALVDGQTVFAHRPDHFGSRVTSETDSILKISAGSSLEKLGVDGTDRDALSKSQIVVKSPSAVPTACITCKGTDRADRILLCDGCDSEYHLECLDPPLTEVPKQEWFCVDCIADREYLYDHCSWGSAGGALVRLLKGNGVWPRADPSWEARVKEWEDNEKVLQRNTRRAIEMGFAGPVEGVENLSDANESSASTDEPKPNILVPKRSAPPSSSETEQPARKRSRIGEEQVPHAEEELVLSKEEVLSMTAWATRHHASQTIATLEAANKGLSEALAIVVAQRDALLALMRNTE